MQTSLARRQRRRRNGTTRRGGGGGTTQRLVIALPLLLLGAFISLAVVGFVAAVGVVNYYSQGLPDPRSALDNIAFAQQTTVTDRTGKVVLAQFGLEKRRVVQFSDISPAIIDATTSIEDHTFWNNAGFDPAGIISAALDTLTGRARGASTITQQLVRARLLPESVLQGNTYERKIKELIQSTRLVQAYPGRDGKEKIITAYLNQNFYGNQSYGIAAAAESYFGVTDLHKLTLAQAAILAGIPQSPTAYDLVQNAVKQKDGSLVVPASATIVQRRNYILTLMENDEQSQPGSMLTAGMYTAADFDKARAEPVVLRPQALSNWKAPQFVYQVRQQLGSILCGPDNATNCPQVDTGGYTVKTTLNMTMQASAEKWVKAAIFAPYAGNGSYTATKSYLASLGISNQTWIQNLHGLNVHNGAMASIDYRTGQVLAYVGSADYYATSSSPKFQPQFDVLSNGWRQPGSAFKPISYVTGIDEGILTAATTFMDVVTDFGGGYTPVDADHLERGPLRLRQALQFSLNIPAIKAASIIGVDTVFQRAKDFGIQFQSQTSTAGVSIAIGTLEVHPIDLIGAYGAIANGGVLMPRTTVLSVTGPDGTQVWPTPGSKTTGTRVVSPQAAYVMTNILAGNTDPAQNPYWGVDRLTDGGVRRPATLKTGTSDNTKDLTAVGYVAPPADPNAPAIVTGAWAGNSDNSAPAAVFSLDLTAPLWQSYMNEVTHGTPIVDFKQPPGLVSANVDAFTGMLPGPYSTKTVKEIFIAGTVPTQVDNTKVPMDIDQATGKLWQDGCVGPKVTQGFLDLSGLDANNPTWQRYDAGWIARAKQGTLVYGGPEHTGTTYFYEVGRFGYLPYGATWGAPFPPTQTCTPGPSPSPSTSPGPSGSGGPFPSLPPSLPPEPSPTPKVHP